MAEIPLFDDFYRGKKVLVTGHTGFKGSWLVYWLIKLGAKVGGFSLSLPTNPSLYDMLELEKDIEDMRGDIRKRAEFLQCMESFDPEVLFHLAAQPIVSRSIEDPMETFETNAIGMANLMDVSRASEHCNTIVLITSDKVYENNEWCYGYRETDRLGGKDPYSASKSAAEIIAQSFYRSFCYEQSEKSFAIARAGNVIGGGDWALSRIVPDCIRAWRSGIPIEVRSPSATRPWQHVLEPLSGYLHLASKMPVEATGAQQIEAFNFGPESLSEFSVAQLIDSMCSFASVSFAKGYSIGDNPNSGKEAHLLKLNCDKASSVLSWRPTLDFAETAKFAVRWYEEVVGNELSARSALERDLVEYIALSHERGAVWAN